ncbi:MAG: chloramphenicol acetyltransferase [Muribaculaceae bacterium]|nr:chloramphenicol acetyltransferase [Muribaculaceae bacterium]
MKEIIQLESFHRKESVLFFKNFVNPNVSVTCMVDASKCFRLAKSHDEKFFHHYLYAILKAANKIKELHYRFSSDGQIVYYDKLDVLAPIRIPGHYSFATLRFPYASDRAQFISSVNDIIRNADSLSSYGIEEGLQENDVILVSALPDLQFTSISYTQKHDRGNDYPLINVGKMGEDGKMPLGICVNHSFVDGEHLSQFYKLVQQYLDEDNIYFNSGVQKM